jgi:hypothetical protein
MTEGIEKEEQIIKRGEYQWLCSDELLIDGTRFASEVRELKELCVGDTYRLTNQIDAEIGCMKL